MVMYKSTVLYYKLKEYIWWTVHREACGANTAEIIPSGMTPIFIRIFSIAYSVNGHSKLLNK